MVDVSEDELQLVTLEETKRKHTSTFVNRKKDMCRLLVDVRHVQVVGGCTMDLPDLQSQAFLEDQLGFVEVFQPVFVCLVLGHDH